MKKTVKFDLFGDSNQYLMFNSVRLAALKRAGWLIEKLDSTAVGMDFVLAALPIAMAQHYHNESEEFYGEKLDEFFERTGKSYQVVVILLFEAIFESGIWGSKARDAVIAALHDQLAAMDAVTDGDEGKNEQGTATTEKPSKPSKSGSSGQKK